MTVDFFASRGNYWRHLAPVADVLMQRGNEVRIWHERGTNGTWGNPVYPRAKPCGDVMVVASEPDVRKVERWRDVQRKLVLVEHGAGQTYVEAPAGWAGGPHMEHIDLFVCPSSHVGAAWHSTYPKSNVAVVGAPALDRFFFNAEGRRAPLSRIYVTSHWRCAQNTETWPALGHHMPAIPELRRALGENGIDLIGHAHPREAARMGQVWHNLGMEYEPDVEVVLGSAALVIADNTSVLVEAGAVGIPLVFLNRPEYRRHVSHGGRFWEWPRGQVSCDEPEDLIDAVERALTDPPEVQEARRVMVTSAYAHMDGQCALRAALAIEEL